MRVESTHRSPWLAFVFLAAGTALGVVGLFFAIANDTWIAVRIPTLPWRGEPYWFAFEARLWVVMLTSFAAGAAVAGTMALRMRRVRRMGALSNEARIRALEQELERVTRLLTVMHKNDKGQGRE